MSREVMARDGDTMLRSVRRKQVDALAITTLEYDQLQQETAFAPIFVTYHAGQITERYVLLAHKRFITKGKTPMKFFLVLLAFLWIPDGIVAQPSDNKDPQIFHIGLSSATFDNLNHNDAMAAIKAWTEAVIKEQDLIEKAEVNFFNSFEALSQAYKNELVDAVSISTEDAMRLEITPEFVYLPSREDGFTVSYALIMHHNNEIKDLGELVGKKFVIYAGQTDAYGSAMAEECSGETCLWSRQQPA